MVSLLFWLIFSILGVQLFSGKFQACVDHDGGRVLANAIPNKTECLRFPEKYVWKNSDANFDNVLNGFLALFLVVSLLSLSWANLDDSSCPTTGECNILTTGLRHELFRLNQTSYALVIV